MSSWLDDEPGRARFLRECARVKRRAAAKPIRIALTALLLTSAVAFKLARKPSMYTASDVYRVSESSANYADDHLPRDSLQDYIATVIFNKQRIHEVREKYHLFGRLASIDPSMALDAMWSSFDVTVSRNYFAEYRRTEMRTAVVQLSFLSPDPKLAGSVIDDFGRILVESERRIRTQKITDTLAVVSKAAADAATAFDEAARQAALVEIALASGKSDNRLFSQYKLRLAKRKLQGAQDRLRAAQQAKSAIDYDQRVELESLGLLYERVDSSRPVAQERGVLGIAVVALLVFAALLPLCALFFAALDNTVYDTGDIRRLGVEVLGHVPNFPGSRVGAIATRRGPGDRVT